MARGVYTSGLGGPGTALLSRGLPLPALCHHTHSSLVSLRSPAVWLEIPWEPAQATELTESNLADAFSAISFFLLLPPRMLASLTNHHSCSRKPQDGGASTPLHLLVLLVRPGWERPVQSCGRAETPRSTPSPRQGGQSLGVGSWKCSPPPCWFPLLFWSSLQPALPEK